MTKTVLITGCSSGFGKAAVVTFRQAGWNVIATMRNIAGWPETDRSKNVLVVPLDVVDTASIEAAFKRGVAHFGTLDCVVNNAGQALLSVFETTPLTSTRAVFETNIFGPIQVMQNAIPYLRENGGGHIVNVSSGSAITPDPLMAPYAASKWALEGLTESLRFELETQNIRVKLVEPGFVASTNFVQQVRKTSGSIPVPDSYQGFVDQTMSMFMEELPFELATERDVADAILAAASDGTGQLRYVVGGDARVSAHMRRETSEVDYLAWAHSRFGVKP